ncbi:MAG TPA: hypothetical protein VNI20_09415 [Fimbriimonadaceae bacterium]|nr:hypothetical protein [Fimbriimonadaceae bacterium]
MLGTILFIMAGHTSFQGVPAGAYDLLQWRCIGPYRGGRTVGASGIAEQPNTFFIGVNNGGVWKTNDAGRTWKPIFDGAPTGSVGDVAVAPSDPGVIYVASGESLRRPDLSVGKGMFKSSDGGKTWSHIGLQDGQQIGPILIDPKNANRVFVAVVGHPYGPNEQRGIFRTLDGGKTWKKVLYKDPDTGGADLAFDPKDPNTVYAVMWESRQGPWENGQWEGPGSGLFKSTDGGDTWRQLTKGLPTTEEGLGKIGISVAPSNGNVIYAMVAAGQKSGIYRSNDAGENWSLVDDERRLSGRGDDFAEIKVAPDDADTVYVANTSCYRSTDGGKEFTCIKGSPGGDDYHTVWVNPLHPEIILLAADQGATISVNGGETWSSWYNQPTAQFYHVSTDNAFPYNVYSGQQESGSAMVSSRGNDGQITFREWHPAGGDEYGYLAPDPLNPRYVYGGRVDRYDKVTGENKSVRPTVPYRVLRTAPVLFSTVDPHVLYFAGNILFKTADGGEHWDAISTDLSRAKPDIPASVGKYRTPEMASMARRGVIYTVAPSYLSLWTIWCGTDDGLIWVTHDGGDSWADVTPPGVTSWSKVSLMDAGHSDDLTAYAAVNRIRVDDMRPHIYRTHDGGKNWTEIVSGLPDDPINVVREDPVVPGLLYCGSETAVYFSPDDGDHWMPLRLNMPATSVRDLVVHEDDLVIGTHGRGFWILDNVTPLRNLSMVGSDPTLFPLAASYELERDSNHDTPLPPEEPAGKNPPDGAMIDYWLPKDASHVTIEVLSDVGKLVRKFSSDDPVQIVDPKSLTVQTGWVRPPRVVAKSQGSHRFLWDMREEAPAEGNGRRRFGPPISAIWGDTPVDAQGPWVPAGVYTIRLTVDGKVSEQTIAIKPDPRT